MPFLWQMLISFFSPSAVPYLEVGAKNHVAWYPQLSSQGYSFSGISSMQL